jgi:hypothetical protein
LPKTHGFGNYNNFKEHKHFTTYSWRWGACYLKKERYFFQICIDGFSYGKKCRKRYIKGSQTHFDVYSMLYPPLTKHHGYAYLLDPFTLRTSLLVLQVFNSFDLKSGNKMQCYQKQKRNKTQWNGMMLCTYICAFTYIT